MHNKDDHESKIKISHDDYVSIFKSGWPGSAVVIDDPDKSLFEEAEKTVKVDRHKDYGSPTAVFEHIASMWNAYLKLPDDRKITPQQVAFMMVLLKLARESFKHKKDNMVDMLGYVGIAEAIRRGD